MFCIMAILSEIKTSWLKYVIALAMLSCFPLHVHADKWVNTQYNTTEGNEFYVTTMKNAGANAGAGTDGNADNAGSTDPNNFSDFTTK